MSQKHSVPKLILRYEGVFNFQELYEHIIHWFTTRNYDYIEKKWKEKEASPEGREITVNMVPEKKVTEYIKYAWELEWKSVDAHPVTIEGEDNKQMHARFHLHVQATVIEDWQDLGKKHTKLAAFFNKYIFKRERENVYIAALEQEMQALLDEVQEQLDMQAAKRTN